MNDKKNDYQKEYQREYAKRDYVIEKRKQHYENNKELYKEYRQKYYQTHKEEIRNKQREYAKNNREKVTQICNNYRKRKAQELKQQGQMFCFLPRTERESKMVEKFAYKKNISLELSRELLVKNNWNIKKLLKEEVDYNA